MYFPTPQMILFYKAENNFFSIYSSIHHVVLTKYAYTPNISLAFWDIYCIPITSDHELAQPYYDYLLLILPQPLVDLYYNSWINQCTYIYNYKKIYHC